MRAIKLATLGVAATLMIGAAGAEEQNYNWSGLYFGGHTGFGQTTSSITTTPNDYWTTSGSSIAMENRDIINNSGGDTFKKSGALAGLHLGYDKKIGPMVVGVVGGMSYYGLGHRSVNGPHTNSQSNNDLTFVSSSVLTTVADLRLRLGANVGANTLVYVTAGLASGRRSFTDSTRVVTANNTLLQTFGAAATGTKTGAIWGAGLEYAFAKHWSLGAEYLHTDLGSMSATGYHSTPDTFAVSYSERLRLDTVKVLLNYKFN
jgi:outer membrane immunogenic protein